MENLCLYDDSLWAYMVVATLAVAMLTLSGWRDL